ncbi:unnamed protein product [Acanthocheilonema viteae]|uniref:Uncharacterized protein n=1 Tax=Acanthocheilonema viteae TaxID=6277 RepID=A0A498SN85_ACAVI|nr:unnamed protein product [Acanthocheilonema viteae]
MYYYKNNRDKKDKKGKRGRKSKLRDINDDIMAQLFVEETEVDEMFSESSDDETESQKHSESSQAVTQLGLKTAAFILQEMIINPSSCCSNQNVTLRLDDKSASGNASRETSADSLKDSGISETCELKVN